MWILLVLVAKVVAVAVQSPISVSDAPIGVGARSKAHNVQSV